MSSIANMLGNVKSRSKKDYTFDEVATILVLKSQGKTVSEISAATGHSSASVNYKINWIRKQGEGLFEYFQKPSMSVEQLTEYVNNLDQKAG